MLLLAFAVDMIQVLGDKGLGSWWLPIAVVVVGQSQRQRANEKLAGDDFGWDWVVGCRNATDEAFRSPKHRRLGVRWNSTRYFNDS